MIDLSFIHLESSKIPGFKDLCRKIYDFVANDDHANLFKVKSNFPPEEYPEFDLALEALIDDSCLANGSRGFVAVHPPEFECTTESNPSEEENPSKDYLKRREFIRKISARSHDVLTHWEGYDPACVVEKGITAMEKGTRKTILNEFFVEGKDPESIKKKYKSDDPEKIIIDFGQRFPLDKRDIELFDEYRLSSNVFTYLFNRSAGYCRLFLMKFQPGFGDISRRIFPPRTEEPLYVHLFPKSYAEIDLHERAMNYLHVYAYVYGGRADDFVSALLALFNGVPVEKQQVMRILREFSGIPQAVWPSSEEWSLIFGNFIESDEKVKFLDYDDITEICATLEETEETDYGISTKVLFKKYQDLFKSHHIDNVKELSDFISKYTEYEIIDDRVLNNGTLKDAIERFVEKEQIYDKNRIIRSYIRRCGGPADLVEPIIKSVDMNRFTNDNPLTEEEKKALSEKLSKFEWITKDNARSVFADLHDLEDKFTEINMFELGFSNLQDAYFRREYPTFKDCLLKNVFVGDDIYVDDRKFDLMMDCRAFSSTVEYLQRTLHWIPVSKFRYINLKSERYEKFAITLAAYKERIIELCKHQFVTPFSLKNTSVGIPEIDEDYYDLEFYDAMLIASGANHQTLAKQRFYFIPSEFTSFEPNAPSFISYIVYNANGAASISEIRETLKSEYGIDARESTIRNEVKQSICIYSAATDAAYLDEESYMEAMRNE